MEVNAGPARPAPMQDTVHVQALAVVADMFGSPVTLWPTLIWDDAGATLVDTGYPGQFAKLRAAVEAAGVPFGRVRRVIVTHQDWDHIGGLADVLRAGGGETDVYAHGLERPYIDGSLPDFKLTPERIAARISALPPEMRVRATEAFAARPAVPVRRLLEDGEVLPFHGGLEVIHVPGHTPGHICLYLRAHRLLIAGDQLRVLDGQLLGPNPEFTPDMAAALASLKKLTAYDIAAVICYHGGLYGGDAAARIAALANTGR